MVGRGRGWVGNNSCPGRRMLLLLDERGFVERGTRGVEMDSDGVSRLAWDQLHNMREDRDASSQA